MIEKTTDKFLDSNIKGLMMSCITLFNEAQIQWRSSTDFQALNDGDMRYFAQLRGRSITISELAREMGTTRQGAHQAIQRLRAEGMVCLEGGVSGCKGKLITITDKGQRFRSEVALHLKHQEQKLRDVLGEERVETLRDILQEICRIR